MKDVLEIAKEAKAAKLQMSMLSTQQKNDILTAIADSLIKNQDYIIEQNKLDLQNAIDNGMRKAMVDRLTLTQDRIKGMAQGVMEIVDLDDPIGCIADTVRRPNGLKIGNMCVPLGVIAIIYEARPNVTSDAVALCIKTGNCIILRGGKEAINSNKAIVEVIVKAAKAQGLPEGAIGLVTDTTRDSANRLMKLHEYVDLLIPRGGASLINAVVQNSTVPTIQTGIGNCHIFVEKTGDVEMAKNIAINAKTQRPSVCNAAETLLLDKGLPKEKQVEIIKAVQNAGVEIHGDEVVCSMIEGAVPAEEVDYTDEYLDLKMAVKIVDGFDGGISHIQKYSSMHSECIITNDYELSQKFTDIIDAAAVYVNASTRFTDGLEFGFGAEMGISTQKLHVRGPMGLKSLTTNKYVIYGNGQVR